MDPEDDFLEGALDDEGLADLPREGVLAVVEALALAVYADGKIEDVERRRFESAVADLPFSFDEEARSRVIGEAAARAIEAAARGTPQAFEDFARAVAARLPEAPVRQRVFRTMARIAVADRDFDESGPEMAVLGAFAAAFGMDPVHARAIVEVHKSIEDIP